MFNASLNKPRPLSSTLAYPRIDPLYAHFNTVVIPGVTMPPGGEPGDLLVKKTSSDGDVEWVHPSESVEDVDIPITSKAVYSAINDIMHNYAPLYYSTEEYWDSQTYLISESRAIYVYSDHYKYEDNQGNIVYIPAIKIGDGTSYLIDMPFVGDAATIELAELTQVVDDHIQNQEIHVSQEDREFWNNKVTSYLDQMNPENLILTKNF